MGTLLNTLVSLPVWMESKKSVWPGLWLLKEKKVSAVGYFILGNWIIICFFLLE